MDEIYRSIVTHFGWDPEFVFRLALSMIVGGLAGLERELRGRPAGLRTHILVALGSTIMIMVSLNVGRDAFQFDPTRIAAGLVTGIGFLGAGTIIKTGNTVRGLTTAASIWCVAAIGMAIGFGEYGLSILGFFFLLFTLIVINWMERGISKNTYKRITVRLTNAPDRIQDLGTRFRALDWRVVDYALRRNKTDKTLEVSYDVRARGRHDYADLVKVLDEADFVKDYEIE